MSIKVGDFSNALKKAMTEYSKEVGEDIAKVTRSLAGAAAKQVSMASSASFKGDGSTGYAKGWTATNISVRSRARWKIHNAKAPGLAHLLEKGHASVNGGRVAGKIHIKPIEEKLMKDYEEAVKAVIAKGAK